MNLFDLREPVSAWSHGAWLLMALPGSVLLWWRAGGDRARQVVLLGYTFCLVLCATASTLYHSVQKTGVDLSAYLLLDHIGIYLLIAGSYTPIAWTLMRGAWRFGTLAFAWVSAALGIAMHVALTDLPAWLPTSLYLAMGWGSILCYFELARRLSFQTLRLVVLGGALYSVGALIHLLNWPVLWPGVVGAHEIFHVFVVAGSVAHYRFMLKVIAPWGWTDPAASAFGNAIQECDPASLAPRSILPFD